MRQFEAKFPIGTKPRLALATLLYTGTRRSDALRLGKQFERDGNLHFTEIKGSTSRAITRKRRSNPKKRGHPNPAGVPGDHRRKHDRRPGLHRLGARDAVQG